MILVLLLLSALILLYKRNANFKCRLFTFLADMCKNYKTLRDIKRNKNFVTVNFKCDEKLNRWYRFQGDAGTKMAKACPPVERCDAGYPAWLSGNHPTVAEGTVSKKVCVNRSGFCCDKSHFIQVKNCGSYYIHKLGDPGTCDARYCGTD